MEIIHSSDDYLYQIKNLWKQSFPLDDEKFIDFYFKKKYKDNNTLIIIENDIVISSLQNLEYDFFYNKKSYKVGYISGAMTLQNRRGQGYMKSLIYKALNEDYKNGRLFSCLIPANDTLFNYYSKLGYRTSFFISKKEVRNCNVKESIKETDFSQFSDYYKDQIKDGWVYLNSHNLNDYKDFFNIYDGKILNYKEDFALVFKNENFYEIPFADIDFNILKNAFDKTIILKSQGNDSPYAMMRIVNAKKFIEMIKLKIPENISIKIIDDVISENNFTFIKKNNEIMSTEKFDYLLKIEDLAEKIKNFKMYLMMD